MEGEANWTVGLDGRQPDREGRKEPTGEAAGHCLNYCSCTLAPLVPGSWAFLQGPSSALHGRNCGGNCALRFTLPQVLVGSCLHLSVTRSPGHVDTTTFTHTVMLISALSYSLLRFYLQLLNARVAVHGKEHTNSRQSH